MRLRSVGHLSNAVLIREVHELVANDRSSTAQLLVHLGEMDRRRLYLPASFPSMYQYCRREFRMSEDVAYKRIQAARVARRFPQVLDGIIDGRLNLTTIVLLRKHLNRRNAERLLKAAEYACKAEVLLLIARESPRPDVATRIVPLTPAPAAVFDGLAAGRPALNTDPMNDGELVPEPVEFGREITEIASRVPEPDTSPPPRIEPLAPERFWLQATIDQETHDLLQRAQELLGHQIAPGDVPAVLKRALTLLVTQLEKRKFGATDKPQLQKPRRSNNSRRIPNAVKREVARRDGNRCTFVSESGHRCEERSGLEFDHINPVARGGDATARNIRLRCRGHNQLEADRVFGSAFMENKRAATG